MGAETDIVAGTPIGRDQSFGISFQSLSQQHHRIVAFLSPPLILGVSAPKDFGQFPAH